MPAAAAVLSFDHSVSEKTMAELVQSAYLTKPNKLLSSFCGVWFVSLKKSNCIYAGCQLHVHYIKKSSWNFSCTAAPLKNICCLALIVIAFSPSFPPVLE